jgi:hypothetical protein
MASLIRMPVVVKRSTARSPSVAAAWSESTGINSPSVLVWATRMNVVSPLSRDHESSPGMVLWKGMARRRDSSRP